MTLVAAYRGRISVYAVAFFILIAVAAVSTVLRQNAALLFLWGILDTVCIVICFLFLLQREGAFVPLFILYTWFYIALSLIFSIFTLFYVFNCLIAGQACPGVQADFGLVFDAAYYVISFIIGVLLQDLLLKFRDVKIKFT